MSIPVETYTADLPREAAHELIDGRWFEGLPVAPAGRRQAFAFFELPNDFENVGDDKASVGLYTTGGNRGDLDRTDRLTVEVYAPGTDAVRICEAIADLLVNDGLDHDLQAGYVDEIRCDVTPHDVPTVRSLNQARAVFLVTYRPTD